MNSGNQIDVRYPIGRFNYSKTDANKRNNYISEIELAPGKLKKAVKGLTNQQLDNPYREGGWTVRQVVHHLPDSHINAYVRFKMALTEDDPQIKTYDEKKWAQVIDYSNTPVEVSLNLLDYLHKRWIIILKSMSPEDFKKSYIHPEWGKVDLDWVTAQYAWHGKHHVAHITSLRNKMGW